MFCQNPACGTEVASNYKICPTCGGRSFGSQLGGATQKELTPKPSRTGAKNVQPSSTVSAGGIQLLNGEIFASFWRRCFAFSVDLFIVSILYLIWFVKSYSLAFPYNGVFFDFQTSYFVLTALYFPLMHSSKFQATLGKMMVGLKVVDNNGQRISIVKGFVRLLASYLSAIILFAGYFMVFFSAKNQALHDKIAGTYVVFMGRGKFGN